MSRPGPGRPTRTTPEEWAQAALDTIEDSGVAALAVEAVARRLGVSKGGFYHHFADRRALLEAALSLWERRFTTELAERFDAVADPRERLRALLRYAAVELEPTVLTRLTAAADDPAVAATLTRAAERRLELLERLFGDLGLAPATARKRALLAYSSYVGLAQLRTQLPRQLGDPRRVSDYLDDVETALLAGLPQPTTRGGRSRAVRRSGARSSGRRTAPGSPG